MHPKKCNQMVFNSSSSKILNKSFHFELFKIIPPCESLKFLGITFDLGLSFNQHIKETYKHEENKHEENKTIKYLYLLLIYFCVFQNLL
jgi:hypothetical protein